MHFSVEAQLWRVDPATLSRLAKRYCVRERDLNRSDLIDPETGCARRQKERRRQPRTLGMRIWERIKELAPRDLEVSRLVRCRMCQNGHSPRVFAYRAWGGDLKDCAFRLLLYDSTWEWSLPPIAARLMTPAALC